MSIVVFDRHRVIRDFGGREASVFLIDYYGVEAVAKVFPPEREWAQNNEVEILTGDILNGMVPRVYEVSGNVIIMEYLRDSGPVSNAFGFMGLLPVHIVRQVCMCASRAHDNGYGLMDLNFGNILVDGDGKVKVIDFENLYRYTDRDCGDFYHGPFALGQSYFKRKDIIYDRGREFPNYSDYWFPRCGVSLESLMSGRPWLGERLYFMCSTMVRRITKS